MKITDNLDIEFLLETGYNNLEHYYQHHKRISVFLVVGGNKK